VTVGVPPASVATESDDIGDRIEAAIHQAAPESDVIVRTEPVMTDAELRELIVATALAHPAVGAIHDVSIFVEAQDHHYVIALHLKLDGETRMHDAHSTAEAVEQAIRSLDRRITAVYSHLEPLEMPISGSHPASDEDLSVTVTELLGQQPVDVSSLTTETGLVAFLTIPVDPDSSLAAAHTVASRLENELRLRRPDLAEVIIDTEPARTNNC
jgi:divalent metal cation (Fe/Co/Zn/Cd) transporter